MKKLSTVVLISLSLLTSSVVFAQVPTSALGPCQGSPRCIQTVIEEMALKCKSKPDCGQAARQKAQQYCSTHPCKKASSSTNLEN
jgi:hypothetical protein